MNLAEQYFQQWINLADPRLGTAVTFATDEFFAPCERLIKPQAPVFIPDRYDAHGKWMDGWESRRRRDDGHDYCVLDLGRRGVIKGFDVDTTHFTGNYPPQISIEASASPAGATETWAELVATCDIEGDHHNYFQIQDQRAWRQIRLHLYPDGGVARLRVFGVVAMDWNQADPHALHDLAAAENGGRVLLCNDMHFGHMHNLIAPGNAVNMGDGWETRRRRTPGNDWAVLALGHSGTIERVLLDTAFFKGNYPDRFSLQGVCVTDPTACMDQVDDLQWQPITGELKLSADQVHRFEQEVQPHVPVNLVRLNIFPDGGVSRLRLFGRPSLETD